MNNWKLKFLVIWSGQAISILSSAVLQMALIWHLTITTGSALILSLASLAGFLPMVLLGSFAGALVDRWNRKLTMIGADLFIAVISLTLVIYMLFAELPFWLVMAVLFLRSIGTAFHTPAISAVTPLIVPESHLTKCSGYTQSLQTLGYIAGASLAALLYPIWGVRGMVALDVGGAVLASITVAVVKIPSVTKTEQEKSGGLLFEIKEGYKIIYENKGLFSLLWIGVAFAFLYAPVNALFPLMSMNYFGGSTLHASIAEVTFSVGMLIGGIVLGLWGGFKNRGITMIFAIVLMGIAVGISGALPISGFIVFAILCFLMGLSAPFYNGPHTSLMQEKISPEFLGRVFGLYGSLMSFALLLGLVVCGIFAEIVGVNIWFLFCGVIILFLGLIAFLMPNVRNVDKEHHD